MEHQTLDVTTSHKKNNCFLTTWLRFSQMLNKLCVVLSAFCKFPCKRFSDIAKKYVWALNVLIEKLNFLMDKRNLW